MVVTVGFTIHPLSFSFVYQRERRPRPVSECLRALLPLIVPTLVHILLACSVNAMLVAEGLDDWRVGFRFDIAMTTLSRIRRWILRYYDAPHIPEAFTNDCFLVLQLVGFVLNFLHGGWSGVLSFALRWSTHTPYI